MGLDAETLMPLLAMGLFAALFGGLIWFSARQTRQRAEALSALAAQRGWQVEQRRHDLSVVVRDPGAGWELELRRPRRNKNSQSPGSSRFRAGAPRLPGGLAYVSVQTAAPGAAVLSGVLGLAGTGIGQAIVRRMVGAEHAALIPDLQEMPAPAGSMASVLATYDPAPHADLRAARRLHDWDPGRGDRTPPFLLLDNDGMELRLNRMLTDPADIDAFVTLGIEMRAGLTGDTDA